MRKRRIEPTEFHVGMRVKFSVPTKYLFPYKGILKKKVYLYGKITGVTLNMRREAVSIIVNCKYKNKRSEYHLGALGNMFISNPAKDVYLCK